MKIKSILDRIKQAKSIEELDAALNLAREASSPSNNTRAKWEKHAVARLAVLSKNLPKGSK